MGVVAIDQPEGLRLLLGEIHIASDNLGLVCLNILPQYRDIVFRYGTASIGVSRGLTQRAQSARNPHPYIRTTAVKFIDR